MSEPRTYTIQYPRINMNTRMYLVDPAEPARAFTVPSIELAVGQDYPLHAGFSRSCEGTYLIRPVKDGEEHCPYRERGRHGHLILEGDDGDYILMLPIESREFLAVILDQLVARNKISAGERAAIEVVLKDDIRHLASELTSFERQLGALGEVGNTIDNTWWVL